MTISILSANSIKECFIEEGGFFQKKYFKDSSFKKSLDMIEANSLSEESINKILKRFIQNARNNNALAAFASIKILNKHYFKNSNKLKNEMIEILYSKQPQMCTANIWKAYMFLKGIETKVDIKKALAIYKKTKKLQCSDWQKNIVKMRIKANEKTK